MPQPASHPNDMENIPAQDFIVYDPADVIWQFLKKRTIALGRSVLLGTTEP